MVLALAMVLVLYRAYELGTIAAVHLDFQASQEPRLQWENHVYRCGYHPSVKNTIQ